MEPRSTIFIISSSRFSPLHNFYQAARLYLKRWGSRAGKWRVEGVALMNVREGSDTWSDDAPSAARSDDTPFLPRVLFSLRRRAYLIVLVWAVTMAAAPPARSLHT